MLCVKKESWGLNRSEETYQTRYFDEPAGAGKD